MISQIYTFTKCMVIKLGRVMTNGEGFLSAKSHGRLITCSREVISGDVTYCRCYIYTLSAQKAHGPYIWEDDYIVEDL